MLERRRPYAGCDSERDTDIACECGKVGELSSSAQSVEIEAHKLGRGHGCAPTERVISFHSARSAGRLAVKQGFQLEAIVRREVDACEQDKLRVDGLEQSVMWC